MLEAFGAEGEGDGAGTVERVSWGFQDDAQGNVDDDVQVVPDYWLPASANAANETDWP